MEEMGAGYSVQLSVMDPRILPKRANHYVTDVKLTEIGTYKL